MNANDQQSQYATDRRDLVEYLASALVQAVQSGLGDRLRHGHAMLYQSRVQYGRWYDISRLVFRKGEWFQVLRDVETLAVRRGALATGHAPWLYTSQFTNKHTGEVLSLVRFTAGPHAGTYAVRFTRDGAFVGLYNLRVEQLSCPDEQWEAVPPLEVPKQICRWTEGFGGPSGRDEDKSEGWVMRGRAAYRKVRT